MPDSIHVAIVGAGPAGFFLAEKLLGQTAVPVAVDLFERLPTPYGLVRFGVAPDHEKIKNVTRSFDKTAGRAGFRFFGNVDVGRELSLDDLQRHYHAVCFTTGAQTDRRMGIPGEELAGSHPATEFVAWFNGHPDYRHHHFDLSAERVAVIGVGNVAVDVARILCRTPEELGVTDIADYALDALRASRVKEVHLLGRRGPVQAAFTTPEVKELGELAGADVTARVDEVTLDSLSQVALDAQEASERRKVEVIQEYAHREASGKARRLVLRFLVSPTELVGDEQGRVKAIRLVRNRLVQTPGGLAAEPTGAMEEIPVGLVFRSVGYRGVAIPGLPFDERRGVVPNVVGRVTVPSTGAALPGVYVAGWIKRGPSGVIGTNKPCAAETAEALLEDAAAGRLPRPPAPTSELTARLPEAIGWAQWARLQCYEIERGASAGRPRVKCVDRQDMLRTARG